MHQNRVQIVAKPYRTKRSEPNPTIVGRFVVGVFLNQTTHTDGAFLLDAGPVLTIPKPTMHCA